MPVQFALQNEQIEALGFIRDLGSETIKIIVSALSETESPPIRPSDLHQKLAGILPSLTPADISKLVGQMMALYSLKRQRHLTPQELLEGLLYGLNKANWSEEQIARWKALEPQLHELLSLGTITNVVKAMDLSFDYANLYQDAKIITDIRPIFNEEASKIEGAIVTYTLRLYYDNIAGSTSLSIALDQTDVENLLRSCERALKKAKTAKEFAQQGGIQNTLISGGDV